MSVSSVFTNNLYSQGNDSGFRQRRADFRQLASALQSGDLNAAQQAYNQLESDLGGSATGAAGAAGTSRFQGLLSQVGTALQSGSISDAQQALANFRSQREQNEAAAPQSGGPGALLDAIFKSLEQAGASSGTDTDSGGTAGSTSATAGTTTASSQNPLQALGAFMHDLFAALQQQGASSTSTTSAGDGDNDGSGATAVVGGGHHPHRGGGLAQVESNLQSLIQQLSTSSNSSSGNSTASSGATSKLQQDYQNLMSALGQTGNSSSLTGFLQALAQNLQGIGSSGSVVNTTA